MKYRTKPELVDVIPYVKGKEDGFKDYDRYIPADAQRYPIAERSTKFIRYLAEDENRINDAINNDLTSWYPYINTTSGMTPVKEGDMIVTDNKHRVTVCSKETLKAYYDEVKGW